MGNAKQKVCEKRDPSVPGCQSGSNIRGAPSQNSMVGPLETDCECDGMRVGDDGCVHWIYFVFFLILKFIILYCMLYKLFQLKKEQKELQQAKYHDMSMEAMKKAALQEPMVDKSNRSGSARTRSTTKSGMGKNTERSGNSRTEKSNGPRGNKSMTQSKRSFVGDEDRADV